MKNLRRTSIYLRSLVSRMYWLHPPIVKIYEAVGAVADGRVEVLGNSAKVYSSSKNKFYTVTYDPDTQSIMMNDNASFYKDYLGYPAISFLMMIGEIRYTHTVAEMLKGIPWKDINQKFMNNFDETLEYVLQSKSPEERKMIEEEVHRIEEQFRTKHYRLLGEKVRPPEGY